MLENEFRVWRLPVEWLRESGPGEMHNAEGPVGGLNWANKASVPYGIKLTGGNVGVAGKKVPLPHYMSMFL